MFKLVACLMLAGALAGAQEPNPSPTEKPRVFITDSQSWEMMGHAGGSGGSFGAETHGGARPQTAEIIKTFGERCPGATVNNKHDKADYIVVLDHEGGKGMLRHKNKVAVFEAQSGDVVVSKSTLSLGGSVEDACKAIAKHWSEHKPTAGSASTASNSTDSTQQSQTVAPELKQAGSHLSITSVPDGADIEIDGSFMGNTPSSLVLAPGDHDVSVKKSGYKAWERKLKISGGDVSLKAELEKQQTASR